ncbi:unnamed protein product [Didymodactylos carnosus]|uniref:Uncharacterized protein n=1 Tax=Didymodactylos carnosus TaxID=1234261 RepID=A0A814P8I6_9BILA|nr:unnamed protein product [Didymodactylos carnosus]CAF1102850.1 unnamed protein product [Didymodactylos carnosus]CAF3566677.1 unnamed protein product [Didymodactylos carnosus]CAF3867627.1 unnamed protein product [Didymodactylos carnosus]
MSFYPSHHLDSLLECSICKERFNDPIHLPCQHNFCRQCLVQCFDTTTQTVCCAHCRTSHSYPNGFDSVPTNFLVAQLSEIQPIRAICSFCRCNDEPLTVCKHCDIMSCQKCESEHCKKYVQEFTHLADQLCSYMDEINNRISNVFLTIKSKQLLNRSFIIEHLYRNKFSTDFTQASNILSKTSDDNVTNLRYLFVPTQQLITKFLEHINHLQQHPITIADDIQSEFDDQFFQIYVRFQPENERNSANATIKRNPQFLMKSMSHENNRRLLLKQATMGKYNDDGHNLKRNLTCLSFQLQPNDDNNRKAARLKRNLSCLAVDKFILCQTQSPNTGSKHFCGNQDVINPRSFDRLMSEKRKENCKQCETKQRSNTTYFSIPFQTVEIQTTPNTLVETILKFMTKHFNLQQRYLLKNESGCKLNGTSSMEECGIKTNTTLIMRSTAFVSTYITIRILSTNGNIYEETFSPHTIYSDIKQLAIRHLITRNQSTDSYKLPYRRSSFVTPSTLSSFSNNEQCEKSTETGSYYKLVSVVNRRPVDDERTLSQEHAKDGDEYILSAKRIATVKDNKDKPSKNIVDQQMINSNTHDIKSINGESTREFRPGSITDFRSDLNKILISLIDAAQKLLYCRPDAEAIFMQAEELLTKSSLSCEESRTTEETINQKEYKQRQLSKLCDMGYSGDRAKYALKKTKYDFNASMEWLLTHEDETISNEDSSTDESDDDDKEQQESSSYDKKLSLFSPTGRFRSFREIRQQRFRPSISALNSLKEVGFSEENILVALKACNNDKNAACEWLLGERNSTSDDYENGLDPESNIYKAIMNNSSIQIALNNPKTFFVMLQIAENQTSIMQYLNDTEIGNMLLQISRIYHAEKDNMSIHERITTVPTTNNE